MTTRIRTGNATLDSLLGGGLLPGTLTVVAGATGIGKTQLGVRFAHAGIEQEGKAGLIFDVMARGDSQNHGPYAQRMCGWSPEVSTYDEHIALDDFYSPNRRHGEYLHVFDYVGQRVTKRDLEFEQWRDWQARLNQKLRGAIAFLYGNFTRGSRRVVFDGLEPTDRAGESIQLNLLEYVYHQVLRKDPEWVARDLFRERYRAHAEEAARHTYDPQAIAALYLYTTHETMLHDLIAKPLGEGDAFANANTLIYMGKVPKGDRIERAIYVAKHRGSACEERIVPYRIDDSGLRFEG